MVKLGDGSEVAHLLNKQGCVGLDPRYHHKQKKVEAFRGSKMGQAGS